MDAKLMAACHSICGDTGTAVSLTSIANLLAKTNLDNEDDECPEPKTNCCQRESQLAEEKALIEKKHKKATALASLANNFAMNEDFKTALKYYSEAIYLKCDDFRFHCNRSYCYEKSGDFESALKDALQAIKLSTEPRPKAFFRKGRALLGLKKFDEAEQAFQMVINLAAECETTKSELFNLRLTALREAGYDEELALLAGRRCSKISEAFDFLTNLELMNLKSEGKLKDTFAQTVRNASNRQLDDECRLQLDLAAKAEATSLSNNKTPALPASSSSPSNSISENTNQQRDKQRHAFHQHHHQHHPSSLSHQSAQPYKSYSNNKQHYTNHYRGQYRAASQHSQHRPLNQQQHQLNQPFQGKHVSHYAQQQPQYHRQPVRRPFRPGTARVNHWSDRKGSTSYRNSTSDDASQSSPKSEDDFTQFERRAKVSQMHRYKQYPDHRFQSFVHKQ
ncbi:Tetratricopeptide repeat protein 31 [Halotydeus destructor]|nr:Tetratricopeptide repeat protein 31 [Halotydeus destructor]